MRFIMRIAQEAAGEKKVIFDPYLEPTFKDDSLLVKMLRQSPRLGDDADVLGGFGANFLELFDMQDIVNVMGYDTIALEISNKVRKEKGKPEQKKPLESINNLVKWFFGDNDERKETPETE
jgi:hypothetical protein